MANLLDYCPDAVTGAIAYRVISNKDINPITRLAFTRQFDAAVSDVIYIGSSGSIAACLQQLPQEHGAVSFFATDDGIDLSAEASHQGVDIVCAPMDPIDLFGLLDQGFSQFRSYLANLVGYAAKCHDATMVVNRASRLFQTSVLVLDDQHQIAASVIRPEEAECPAIQQVLEANKITSSVFKRLTDTPNHMLSSKQIAEDGAAYIDHCRVFYRPLLRPGTPLYHLILARHGKDLLPGDAMLVTLNRALSLLEGPEGLEFAHNREFTTFIEDFRSRSIGSEQEVRRRISRLPIVLDTFAYFLVADFDEGYRIPKNEESLAAGLSQLISNSDAGVVDHRVYVLFGRPFKIADDSFGISSEPLNRLLTQHHACACFTNGARQRSILRVPLEITSRILELARALRENPDERIFYFPDWADYVLIDHCYQSFKEQYGDDNLLFLAHVDVNSLYQYDLENDDILLELCCQYCLNNLSISKTAEACHLHRNTVATKVKKIEQLIHDDLSDITTQRRFVMSYQILNYLGKCTGRRIDQRIDREGLLV